MSIISSLLRILIVVVVVVAIIIAYINRLPNAEVNWDSLKNLTTDSVQHKIFELNSGRRIEYFEFGDLNNPNAEQLLIIPGTVQTGHYYTISEKFHKAHNIRVICPTLPGSGSDIADYQFNATSYINNDLDPLINHVFPEGDFSVVGVSMGGTIASHVASRYDRVKNLLLGVSMGPMTNIEESEIEYITKSKPLRSMMQSKIVSTLLCFFIYLDVLRKEGAVLSKNEVLSANREGFDPQHRKAIAKDFRRSVTHGFRGMTHAFDVMSSPWEVDWDQLSKKNVIILSGELDDTVPDEIQKYLHRKIKNSRFISFDGAHIDVGDLLEEMVLLLLNKA
ncbi:biotin biosynthesis bifunctional protein BioHC [Acrasis kona]|uniref:Biotin biosynthesis bifunctional protein BioHC n=1 Tax=Acrasis kona TaxID=1008807 RepID=A0AAW2YRU6_9EUKA